MDAKNYVLSKIKEALVHYFDDLDDFSTTDEIVRRLKFVKGEIDQAIEIVNAVTIAKQLNDEAKRERIVLKF